ncbi:TPA: ATP-binding protein [Staphylococcus pseudintermedius]
MLSGKTHLAISLGVEACKQNSKTRFYTFKEGIERLATSLFNNQLVVAYSGLKFTSYDILSASAVFLSSLPLETNTSSLLSFQSSFL